MEKVVTFTVTSVGRENRIDGSSIFYVEAVTSGSDEKKIFEIEAKTRETFERKFKRTFISLCTKKYDFKKTFRRFYTLPIFTRVEKGFSFSGKFLVA